MTHDPPLTCMDLLSTHSRIRVGRRPCPLAGRRILRGSTGHYTGRNGKCKRAWQQIANGRQDHGGTAHTGVPRAQTLLDEEQDWLGASIVREIANEYGQNLKPVPAALFSISLACVGESSRGPAAGCSLRHMIEPFRCAIERDGRELFVLCSGT
jgi:hypothetical protein